MGHCLPTVLPADVLVWGEGARPCGNHPPLRGHMLLVQASARASLPVALRDAPPFPPRVA